jgi:hypothetical protein
MTDRPHYRTKAQRVAYLLQLLRAVDEALTMAGRVKKRLHGDAAARTRMLEAIAKVEELERREQLQS